MARLIDADDLSETVKGISKDAGFYRPLYEGFLSVIVKAATVDAADVVRCKDCKYSYCNKYCTNEQWKDNGATVTIEADDFCSYAERKEG